MLRALTLFAAHAASTAAIETVYPDFKDEAGLAAYAARARRDGFTGMMAIHPAQVPVINAAFTPSDGRTGLGQGRGRRLCRQSRRRRAAAGGPHDRRAAPESRAKAAEIAVPDGAGGKSWYFDSFSFGRPMRRALFLLVLLTAAAYRPACRAGWLAAGNAGKCEARPAAAAQRHRRRFPRRAPIRPPAGSRPRPTPRPTATPPPPLRADNCAGAHAAARSAGHLAAGRLQRRRQPQPAAAAATAQRWAHAHRRGPIRRPAAPPRPVFPAASTRPSTSPISRQWRAHR